MSIQPLSVIPIELHKLFNVNAVGKESSKYTPHQKSLPATLFTTPHTHATHPTSLFSGYPKKDYIGTQCYYPGGSTIASRGVSIKGRNNDKRCIYGNWGRNINLIALFDNIQREAIRLLMYRNTLPIPPVSSHSLCPPPIDACGGW